MADLTDLLADLEESLTKLWERQCLRSRLIEPFPTIEITETDLLPTGYPYFEGWETKDPVNVVTNALNTPYYEMFWEVRRKFWEQGRFPLSPVALAELREIAGNAWQLSKIEQFLDNAELTFIWEMQSLADKLLAAGGEPVTQLVGLPIVEFSGVGVVANGDFEFADQAQNASLLTASAGGGFYLTNRLQEFNDRVATLYPTSVPAPVVDGIAGVLTRWTVNLPTIPSPLPNWLEAVINGLIRLTPLVLLPKSLKALAVGILVKVAQRGLEVAIDALIDALFAVLEPETCQACQCYTNRQTTLLGTLTGSGLLDLPVPSGDRENLRLFFQISPSSTIVAPYRPKSSGPDDLPRWFQAGYVALTWPGPFAAEEVALQFGSQVLELGGATGLRYWVSPAFEVAASVEHGECVKASA